jgi:TRAP-type C4-dicarboxylate transport system permease small subunit
VEEAVLIAFVWAVFLGTVTAYRNNKHIAIDVVFNRLPAKARRVIDIAADILLFGMNVYMTCLAVILCSNVGRKSTFVMRLPYFYIDLILVICFGLMAVFGAFRLYCHWQDARRPVPAAT